MLQSFREKFGHSAETHTDQHHKELVSIIRQEILPYPSGIWDPLTRTSSASSSSTMSSSSFPAAAASSVSSRLASSLASHSSSSSSSHLLSSLTSSGSISSSSSAASSSSALGSPSFGRSLRPYAFSVDDIAEITRSVSSPFSYNLLHCIYTSFHSIYLKTQIKTRQKHNIL